MEESETSQEDPHYFTIKGRRWRRTDPNIPSKLNQELVNALMNARRQVKIAKQEDDSGTLEQARRRVSDCKNALGERGHPWWEPYTQDGLQKRVEATIFALLHHRGCDKSICPSDVARIIGGENWRDYMDEVRTIAITLRDSGHLFITQKDETKTGDFTGPIRLRLCKS